MSTKPTYEQAQLHLQVYDQRREAKLRQARDWFFKNYHVTSLDDAMRVAPMGSETGAFASMVALALFNANHHALAVDVADFEPAQFRSPHGSGIQSHDQGAVKKVVS